MAPTALEAQITILGSGTCVPSLERSACAVLIRVGGRQLVFDAGPGTMRRLLEAGTTIFEVDVLFLSHFHPDHSAELVPLLFANKYGADPPRSKPLTVVTGPGGEAFFQGLRAVYGPWIELPGDLLRVMAMAPGTLALEGLTVTACRVVHNPESVAYRIETPGGHRIVYSGDTDYSTALIALADGADILICEAAFPDEMKVTGHMTPSQAGEVARLARVGHLVLTHFYPACQGVDVARQCRRHWDGRLTLAQDLMQIPLESP
jgi:ribonuclease BN (tRNA processing enzyme)